MEITDIFILITIVAIGVFDIYIIFKNGKKSSISAWFIRNSKKYSSIPFLMGFVMGHLFWNMSEADWKTDKEVKNEQSIHQQSRCK